MITRTQFRVVLLALVLLAGAPAAAAPKAAAPQTPAPAVTPLSDAWPREFTLSNATVRVYPPQVSKWVDNQVDFRCAIAIRPANAANPKDTSNETFGVIFATARTHIDKVSRTVVLDNFTITKSDFPALPDRGASYMTELGKQFAGGVRSVALDRMEMALASASRTSSTVAVRNDAPRVIISNSPAILIPIDGAPVLKPVAGNAAFQRVINTKALILKGPGAPQFFMHVYDGWLMAQAIEGPWTQPFLPPNGMDTVAAKISATGVVDMLDGGPNANPRPSLAQGIPTIYTSQVPAELIVFNGKPEFVPIVGTKLEWAANTPNDVLRETASSNYFVLLAGRWFSAGALTGPWNFVASNALPADFALIPPTSLAGAVLATVAGTTQAREAAIENSIPQTVTIPLKNGPTFTATFDGPPQFIPIADTALSFAANAPVPVIKTAPDAFYALMAGVWFNAAAPTGPWSIATSVPAAIYTIPPSSPIFYVTFARIYGATPDSVFAGYTPGYLGAVTAPTGNVVFGTGYAYQPWIGNAWYAPPVTYGVAATPVHNRFVGYTYGFAMGLATVAWSQANAGGANFHPGYWGGYPCCGSASANVYRYWARAANAKANGANAKQAGATAPAARKAAPVNTAALPPPVAAAPGASRGYDTTMVPPANAGSGKRSSGSGSNTPYISANAYYASIGQSASNPTPVPLPPRGSNVYADPDGNVYRQDSGTWQQHSSGGWSNAPAAPSWGDQETQARDRADESAEQAASFSISNATRFTGDKNDGWSKRDRGDGGYSRTLGGSGGIGAEVANYNDQIFDAEFQIARNGYVCGNGVCVTDGGWWGGNTYVGTTMGPYVGGPYVGGFGGFGWGGRYGY